MTKFAKLSSWACSVACGVCLALAMLAVSTASADPPGGGTGAPAKCANPSRDSCPENGSQPECIGGMGCDDAKGKYCSDCVWSFVTDTCSCP